MTWKIESERCIIRPFVMTDLEDLYEYASVDGVGVNAGWPTHTSKEVTRTILKEFLQKTDSEFAIELKKNKKVIGSFKVHNMKNRAVESREIGYVLSKAYWGQGIMCEVIETMLSYLFTKTKIELITVKHFDYNQKSQSVINKSGFKYEGRLRKAGKNGDGKVFDSCVYSLLKEEWEDKNA